MDAMKKGEPPLSQQAQRTLSDPHLLKRIPALAPHIDIRFFFLLPHLRKRPTPAPIQVPKTGASFAFLTDPGL